MTAYYNEHDPFAAAWLRELIADGLLAPGDVDTRSIVDVTPSDLVGYTQCHFFAGIGGWSYALRLAGWPDDRPVWTGSAPCQPFSAAGKGAGFDDERHLWPSFFWLIQQCRPGVLFGEQVEAAIRHGWLDLISTDLEGIGYAFAAVGLPAASVGAPHIRQRLWFVSESMEHSKGLRRVERGAESGRGCIVGGCGIGGLADSDSERRTGEYALLWSEESRRDTRALSEVAGSSETNGPWSDAIWIPCRDGKARPVEPGIFPLAHGVPNRVGLLRGAGNAIVPQVAAEVIKAYDS